MVATRPIRVFTQLDTGFNGITWTRAGVFSLDLWVRGLKRIMGAAIADDAWDLDYYVYNEDATATIFGPIQVATDVGILGGQTEFKPFFVEFAGAFDQGWADRIRFRGRGHVAAVTGGKLRVYGE